MNPNDFYFPTADFYARPSGDIEHARTYAMTRYRDAMISRFNARQVSLHLPPKGWTPTSEGGASAVAG